MGKKLERLVKRRELMRGRLVAAITALSDAKGFELQAKLQLLSDRNSELKLLDAQIFDSIEDNASADELESECNEVDQYQEKVNIAQLMFVNKTCKTSDDLSVQTMSYKLPQLELQKFDLTPENWTQFWGQYKRIYNDTDLSASDKFQYLIMSLDVNSKARNMVEAYPQEGMHYEKAIESLKKRFGRDEFVIEIYTRKILSLMTSNEPLPSLYDKLSSYIMVLESLGMAMSKCAFMLYPIVESCLPTEILQEWERVRLRNSIGSKVGSQVSLSSVDDHTPLQDLMEFLESEVRSQERVLLAKGNFNNPNLSTTTVLASSVSNTIKKKFCIFCRSTNTHYSSSCAKAPNMAHDERMQIVLENNCCFLCLRRGHYSKQCRIKLKCDTCLQSHVSFMCPKNQPAPLEENSEKTSSLHATVPQGHVIYLKTLMVNIFYYGNGKSLKVRALLDDGSHRSYIKSELAEKLKLSSVGSEIISHGLFGGLETKAMLHQKFKIKLMSVSAQNSVELCVINNDEICGEIPRVNDKKLISELSSRGISLSDVGDKPGPIEILLGADVLGQILTGRIEVFKHGLSAIETTLGWSILGTHRGKVQNMLNMVLFNLPTLWDLETIGISDPIERISKKSLDDETMDHFRRTIRRSSDGRYEVSLPWLSGHPPLHNNKDIASRRLQVLTSKLISSNSFHVYDEVLSRWETEGIIEEISGVDEGNSVHYLPHRAVVKEGKSTRLRPVFDPSVKRPGYASLNECLSAGPSLSQQINPVLLRFRFGMFGVTGDIRQAFQMISVQKKDRDVLRFLWWTSDKANQTKTFRHCRVPFGVSTSPFLLNATIQHHLENPKYNGENYGEIASLLKSSFYVDDCVVGNMSSIEQVNDFITKASLVMNEGGFELRGWNTNSQHNTETVSVLGLKWNLGQDTLLFPYPDFCLDQPMTKRSLLSLVSRVYDPIGVTAGAMIPPKSILQMTWKRKLGWTDELPEDLMSRFNTWVKYFSLLQQISLPRRLVHSDLNSCTLHVLSDGSNTAYGACVFIRCEDSSGISVQLVSAKARVAPLANHTIPRLELLGACLGIRLSVAAREALKPMKTYYWTDSSVVLFWIKRNEPWGTFVGNRIKEIRQCSNIEDWRHIPGELNVEADMLSRGCNFETLLKSRWWEGPEWLYKSEENWPQSDIGEQPEAYLEKKKILTNLTLHNQGVNLCDNLAKYCSSFNKAKRVSAWIFRFANNARFPLEKLNGPLSLDEIKRGEEGLIKALQSEWSRPDRSQYCETLPIDEKDGVLRVRTKLINGPDQDYFQRPILLPDHEITKLMARDKHNELGHCGVQTMLTSLREQYWIHRARKICRSVVRQCAICQRYRSQSMKVSEPGLPDDRIANVPAFLHSGCDMAGPIFLSGNQKAWILVITCSVYRAVHLELVESLSSDSFIQALRRFIARRGRCQVMRCDNGGNFVGTCRSLGDLDWTTIQEQSDIMQIQWKFNVPAAPWWTGFVERMVGLVKSVLKKVLGQACLTTEEMCTALCDCENVINSRPLTYIGDSSNLVPLTPNHFIRGIPGGDVDDLDVIDSNHHVRRFRYLQHVRDALRNRFREEYLSELVGRYKTKETRELSVGEVVLLGADNVKRQKWPLAVITQLIPGNDGVVRTVKVRVANNELFRPIQRIYPLEIKGKLENIPPFGGSADVISKEMEDVDLGSTPDTQEADDSADDKNIPPKLVSRRGRVVKPPVRLNL